MRHTVTIEASAVAGGRFFIDCHCCGEVGTADDRALAEVIKRLHEAFIAMLVDTWSVTR